MDDRKNLFVIIFITFFVMVYVQWMFPQQPQVAPVVNATTPQVNVTTTTGVVTAPTQIQGSAAIAPTTVDLPPSLSLLSKNPQTAINTGVAIFTINHLGGRIQSVQLKRHTKTVSDKHPFEMIQTAEGLALPLGVFAEGVSDDFTLYTLKSENLPALEGPYYTVSGTPLEFIFEGALPNGTTISKKLVFKKDSYAFDLDVSLGQAAKDGQPISVNWTYPMTKDKLSEEAHIRRVSTLTADKKLNSTYFPSIAEGAASIVNGAWIAICDYYFIDAIIGRNGSISTQEGRVGDNFFIRAFGNAAGGAFTIFAGPKEMATLTQVGYSLERSVDLGWFSFLAHPILAILRFFYSLIGNYGLSIILLTLLIKLGFLPLTQASFKSMKAMQEIQPEVAALRERVKDPNVLNQELMGLYKKKGVNPLGGCLPILIQIPVFLGLYNALLNSIELRHEPFALWINDLSSPEKLEVFGIGIPLMILLMGASMFWQQKTQPSTLDPQQQKIMLFMPLIFTGMFILHPMPSGLVLYWLVNNTISIVQQIYLKGHKSEVSPLKATGYASFGILLFGYLLTLL